MLIVFNKKYQKNCQALASVKIFRKKIEFNWKNLAGINFGGWEKKQVYCKSILAGDKKNKFCGKKFLPPKIFSLKVIMS